MKKLLIFSAVIASGFISACSNDPIITNMPGIYKVDIKQGNVINQESLNQLKPGMTRRQVRYVLGTPLVVDVFHQNRWDYMYYDYLDGDTEQGKQRISVYFENDKLSRLDGDMRPGAEAKQTQKDFIVEVPPQKPENPGLITQALEGLGILGDETEESSAQAQQRAQEEKTEKGFIRATLERFGLGDEEEAQETSKE
ncbi:MAG: outer membrane protein assembly factor BamE [Methylococcales bacterium]|jgi:outer membrane protein assembly factor BamE|nr:outer membrane protein assembly factor BamE [Methylococcales bacterium]MBT7444545.1 outer membrane protein assembly factor BamE [Methylococcales bacterium]